jgi:hypothetical protein
MRFSSTNLVTEDATDITASSANPNFPVSNLKNPLRSKRWRSSGSFIVDDNNDKIDFKDTALGSELHATLTHGIYSPTALAAEIKSKMEAVSSHTYTVTFSTTTGLWTISTNHTFLSLLNLTGVNNGYNTFVAILGFPSVDKTGSTSYTGSSIAIHLEENLVFDFKTSQPIQNVVLLWPKEDGIKLSDNAVITLQASATNDWNSPPVDIVITPNTTYEVCSHFFSTAQSYRYWKLKIYDPTNPYLYVELGQIWIGENIEVSAPENGFKYKLNDQSKTQSNEFGHRYSDEYPQIATLDFDTKYMYYADYQVLEDAFRQNGSTDPVLCCFDETEVVFNKDHILIYGTMDKSFELAHVSYNLMNSGIKITELG